LDLITNRLPDSDSNCSLKAKLKAATNGNNDMPNWDFSTNGNFSLKTTYNLIRFGNGRAQLELA
jgi:hypothetical protein